ncbi:MAG: nitroreductase family protein, partial [Bacteroidales bacterium]|nr:nitroreductase family protein [Bacteroidales bacterium]
MQKPANNIYPIHPLIRKRWSPRAFLTKSVEKDKLQSLFEAARWAASGSNDQPWQFIVGFNGDETWNRIFETLVEFNQLWTKEVPVLLVACANTISKKSGRKNPSYEYDLGQAVATLSLQATHMGLFVHQMGGFDKAKTVLLFELPNTSKPIVAIAIG